MLTPESAKRTAECVARRKAKRKLEKAAPELLAVCKTFKALHDQGIDLNKQRSLHNRLNDTIAAATT